MKQKTLNNLHLVRLIFSMLVFILSIPLIYSQSSKLPEKGFCAHRGAMTTHPENTLSAFQEAVRVGAHMIEMDVQLSKDGSLVIMHDRTVDRTTNGTGEVAEMDLVEIKALDAGSWKSPEFAGEKVPVLEEVLEIMPQNIWLNIHLRGGVEVGKKVAELIIQKGRQHQAVLVVLEDPGMVPGRCSREY